MENGYYQYAIEMKSPIGSRYGRLALTLCGESVSGMLTLFRQTLPIKNGSCRGESIRFAGEMKTMLYTLAYEAEGAISKTGIALTIKTEKGVFKAVGRACLPGLEEAAQS